MQKDIYTVFHSSVDHLIKRSHGLQSLVAINIAEVQIFVFFNLLRVYIIKWSRDSEVVASHSGHKYYRSADIRLYICHVTM